MSVMDSDSVNVSFCNRSVLQTSDSCLEYGAPSCCFPDMSHYFTVICGLYWLISGIIGGIGNTITLVALPYSRRRCKDRFSPLKSHTLILLLHLSFADCMFSSIVLVLGGANMLVRGWPFSQLVCKIYGFFTHFFGIGSRIILAVTTFYRALSLWWPKASGFIFHSLNGVPALTVMWIYPLCFPVAVIIEGGFGYSRESGNCLTILVDTPVTNKLYGISAVIPLALTVISLFAIGIKLRLNWSEITGFKDMSPRTLDQFKEREKRMAILLVTLAVIYIISLTPNITGYLFSKGGPWTAPYLYFTFLTLIYFPSNFVIYIMRIKSYRKAYVTFFKDIASYLLRHKPKKNVVPCIT